MQTFNGMMASWMRVLHVGSSETQSNRKFRSVSAACRSFLLSFRDLPHVPYGELKIKGSATSACFGRE